MIVVVLRSGILCLCSYHCDFGVVRRITYISYCDYSDEDRNDNEVKKVSKEDLRTGMKSN